MKGLGKLCARRLELGTVSAEPLFARVLVAKLRPLGETVGLYARAYFWRKSRCVDPPAPQFRSQLGDGPVDLMKGFSLGGLEGIGNAWKTRA